MFQDSSCRCLIDQQATTSGTSETDHCYRATKTTLKPCFHSIIFVLLTVTIYKIIFLAVPPSHTPFADTHTIKTVMSDITCTTATILTKPNPNLNLKTSNTPLKLWHPAKWSSSQTWHHFASRRVFWCSICSKCWHTHTPSLLDQGRHAQLPGLRWVDIKLSNIFFWWFWSSQRPYSSLQGTSHSSAA